MCAHSGSSHALCNAMTSVSFVCICLRVRVRMSREEKEQTDYLHDTESTVEKVQKTHTLTKDIQSMDSQYVFICGRTFLLFRQAFRYNHIKISYDTWSLKALNSSVLRN